MQGKPKQHNKQPNKAQHGMSEIQRVDSPRTTHRHGHTHHTNSSGPGRAAGEYIGRGGRVHRLSRNESE
eukprot:719117-Prorocentrum_minimum.AAC.1